MTNKYKGTCSVCGQPVQANTGLLEKKAGKWAVKHQSCNNRPGATMEDYPCSDMGYEDQCARS